MLLWSLIRALWSLTPCLRSLIGHSGLCFVVLPASPGVKVESGGLWVVLRAPKKSTEPVAVLFVALFLLILLWEVSA